jgi:transposase InsO family protein
MDAWGFGGSRRIAQTLARAGWRVGRETVRRWRRARRPLVPRTSGRPLVAWYPNHVWLVDITTLPGFLGLRRWRLVVLLDAWARFPVGARLCVREPRAREIARLLRTAARTHGRPRYVVSDRGAQFTSRTWRGTAQTLGIRLRFGAITRRGSTAVIERVWRTVKALTAVRQSPVLATSDLEARLALALHYYTWLRPHAGLGGATPGERYHGIVPAHQRAHPPPRARPGPDPPPTVGLAFLDAERRFPLLVGHAA